MVSQVDCTPKHPTPVNAGQDESESRSWCISHDEETRNRRRCRMERGKSSKDDRRHLECSPIEMRAENIIHANKSGRLDIKGSGKETLAMFFWDVHSLAREPYPSVYLPRRDQEENRSPSNNSQVEEEMTPPSRCTTAQHSGTADE